MFLWSWLGMLVPFGGRATTNIGCQWGNLTENHLPHLPFFRLVRRSSLGGAKINNMTQIHLK